MVCPKLHMLEGSVDRGKPDVLYSVRFCNMSLFARWALEDAPQQGCKACTNLNPKFNVIGQSRKVTRSRESFHWRKQRMTEPWQCSQGNHATG